MVLFCLAFLPMLLWDEGPQTAPALEKAGIREIAITGDVAAWASTRVRARSLDAASLIKLSPPGVDYQIGRASATAAPWVKSNLWRLLKDQGKAFVYDVTGNAVTLAMAEAQTAGATAYFRVKPDDLATYQKSASFARGLEAGPLPSRANFGLVDDGTPVMEEVMNLLARRNLLFEPIRNPADFKGPVVQVGAKD